MEDENTSNSQKPGASTTSVPQPEVSRQSLVDKAIKFLENPKVKYSPLTQKRAFLESKGLTPAEIDLAIASSATVQDVVSQTSHQQIRPEYQHINMYQPMAPSFWTRLRDICATGVLVCSALYGLYHLFKKYILPYFFGIPSEATRLKQVEKQMTEFQTTMNTTVLQMHETLQDVQVNIQQLNKKQDSVGQVSQGMPKGMEVQFLDLKQDISSLKGLLLNRHQFPATPSIAPIIPTWQMASKSEDNAETVDNENESLPVEENGADENNVDSDTTIPQ